MSDENQSKCYGLLSIKALGKNIQHLVSLLFTVSEGHYLNR